MSRMGSSKTGKRARRQFTEEFRTGLLTKSDELEQRLTLLHECIHMDFALGDHNERWLRIQERASKSLAEIRAMPTTTAEEADRQGYLERRNLMALTLLRLPDKIVRGAVSEAQV